MITNKSTDETPKTIVRAALRDCYDPNLPCNIVDLGLVDSITLSLDPEAPGSAIPGVPTRYCATITLTPTSHDEAANAQLSAQIQNRLAGLQSILSTEVILLDHPAWTPHRITPAGRKLLGLDGNPNLVQIAQQTTPQQVAK